MATIRPQAVVFDLGKVLLDFDYRIAVQRLLARSKISVAALQQVLTQGTLLRDYESGRLTSADFFGEVKSLTGFAGDLDEFAALFGNIFSEIHPMTLLQAELRRGGVPTYIFSNTNELAVDHIRRHFPFFNQFDGYILSYEHQSMKPDAALYEVVERVTGMTATALLYFDDRPENIEAAIRRGWQAIVHENPETSRKAIERAGLLTNHA